MAVFRVEKNKNYTVMSNHHLRDRNLSVKAKGLLSLMLSLPDDWDYTLRGLTTLSKDKSDSIRVTVCELEKSGYIKRARIRNAKGQLASIEYTIYESPQTVAAEQDAPIWENPIQVKNETESPIWENPIQVENETESPIWEKPILDKPMLEKPILENPTQLSTKLLSTNILNKEALNKKINKDVGEQEPHSSIHPSVDEKKRKKREMERMDWQRLRQTDEKLKTQIDYPVLCEIYGKGRIDELLNLMLEILVNRNPVIRIGKQEWCPALVKERISKLDMGHIQYILDSIDKTNSDIRNMKAYLQMALINAPVTIEHYYTREVQADMGRLE